MYNSFLKKFTKYTPTPEHAGILCKMTDYKVRVDKQQKLIDLSISFPEYVPYGIISEISEGIKLAKKILVGGGIAAATITAIKLLRK